MLFALWLLWVTESINTMVKNFVLVKKINTNHRSTFSCLFAKCHSQKCLNITAAELLSVTISHYFGLWECLTTPYFCFFIKKRSDCGKLFKYSGWIRSKILQNVNSSLGESNGKARSWSRQLPVCKATSH